MPIEQIKDAATRMLYDELRIAIETACDAKDAGIVTDRATAIMNVVHQQNTGLSRHHRYEHTDIEGGRIDLEYRMRDQSRSYRAAPDLNTFTLTASQSGSVADTHQNSFED